ncbi:MAG: SURF1 family protein, partial [Alcanivorax sp.]|nr:SURF1 family protein [Alcanivorax sp.]
MAPRTARRWPGRLLWGALALLAFIGFLALGQWQLERRAWKLDLIERVEQRVDAPPVAAPAGADIDPQEYEYLRVRLHGEFLHQRETLVQASTVLGSGY